MSERKICGAKTRAGHPCKAQPMANGRCKNHGGKSLAGIASPTFKHGRYSKHLPSRLAERYHEAATDPALLELSHEIALLDARLGDLLGRVDTGEAGRHWTEAQTAFVELKKALAAQDPAALSGAVEELQKHLRAGQTDYLAWAEVYNVVEQRRRLSESERKRLEAAKQTITADRAMVLISALLQIIKTHVTDAITLAAIGADVRALIDKPDR